MMKIARGALFAVGVSGAVLLSACGPQAEAPQTEAAPATVEAPPAEPKAATDVLQPQYAATLAEGIDFKRPGYPEFLSDVSGMSGVEAWGRWTDANLGDSATFRFKQPLPVKFTLEVTGYSVGPNAGQPIRVRVGDTEKTFTFADAPAQTTTVEFEGGQSADSISLIAPHSVQPSAISDSADTRKLGLALVSLKIRE